MASLNKESWFCMLASCFLKRAEMQDNDRVTALTRKKTHFAVLKNPLLLKLEKSRIFSNMAIKNSCEIQKNSKSLLCLSAWENDLEVEKDDYGDLITLQYTHTAASCCCFSSSSPILYDKVRTGFNAYSFGKQLVLPSEAFVRAI